VHHGASMGPLSILPFAGIYRPLWSCDHMCLTCVSAPLRARSLNHDEGDRLKRPWKRRQSLGEGSAPGALVERRRSPGNGASCSLVMVPVLMRRV